MASRFAHGDTVQTRLGKGVIREVRNGGRVLVDVQGRALVVSVSEISAVPRHRRPSKAAGHPDHRSNAGVPRRDTRTLSAEIDLHGLTVDEALERAQQALNEALLGDLAELRFIHGRSGGRIRAALHRHLRETPSVRNVRLDPRNEGVTIVSL